MKKERKKESNDATTLRIHHTLTLDRMRYSVKFIKGDDE